MKSAKLLTCALPSLLAVSAHAEEGGFIQWSSSNIQVLRGSQFEVGPEERTIVTLEHANSWKYGDFFAFADLIWPDEGDATQYAEFSPRFSLSKMTGQEFKAGPIKDLSVSTTIETPKDRKARFLYGLGVDFDVPGFAYFKTNFYVRDDPALDDSTWQATLVWKKPFNIGNTKWVTEGFADFSGAEGTSAANQFIVPRVLMDVGAASGGAKDTFFVGVEYSYWRNKFGIDGVTESNPQLQAKLVF